MAWPLNRILDFIDYQTKIGADFLNALQDWAVAVSKATITLKAVVVDGTGGAAATPVAGTIKVSRKAGGTTLPLPAIASGQLNVGGLVMAWGLLGGFGDGTLAWGQGLAGTSPYKTSNGTYVIPLQLEMAKVVAVASTTEQNRVLSVSTGTAAGVTSVTIRVADMSNTATDTPVYFIVVGEPA